MNNYIFDLFGTLVETRGFSTLVKSLFPEIRYDILRDYTIRTNFENMDNCLDCISQKFDLVIDEKRRKNIISSFAEWKKNAKLYPHVVQMLTCLREKKAKIAIISNNHFFTESTLSDLGLEAYFDVVIFSHQVGFCKPQEEIYNICIQKMGVGSSTIIMVGDQLEKDVLKPVELGMRGVLFDPKNKSDYSSRITNFLELLE